METMRVNEENKLDETNSILNKNPSKFTIVKNASILSVSIMLYLSANLPCSELQSSINIKDGLGVYAETVNNFVGIFASLTLPTLFVNKIGLKHTISFGLIINTLYYFANLHAAWGTMIPAAIITSLFSAPLWPAKASYLTILAEQASNVFNLRKDHALSIMFGFFYSFYYFGYIWGNAASYFILMPSSESNVTEEQLGICGLYFCDSDALDGSNSNFTRPPDKEIYILFGVFIGVTLFAALIIALFMDPLKETKSKQSAVQLVFRTLRDMANPKHILLLPLSILRGLSLAYLSTEYTKAFVSCAWGIHNIGLVMISFGVICGTSSLLLGKIVRYTGRIPLFTSAVVVHVIVAIVIAEWRPNTDQTYVFFVVPILQGFCNSVWESQVAAIYAMMFPDDREVIFSIYCVAGAVGGTIAQSYSATLCTQYKLLIYMILVGIGYCCYMVAEFKYLRYRKKK